MSGVGALGSKGFESNIWVLKGFGLEVQGLWRGIWGLGMERNGKPPCKPEGTYHHVFQGWAQRGD